MSELILFENSTLPAHIARMFSGSNEDLQGGLFATYPVISIKGKVFHIVVGDKRTLVCRPGTDEPASSLEIVILKANPAKSKLYYADGYEEGAGVKPTCYSNDSKAPAADAQVKQSVSCQTCPRQVWGSKVTETGAKSRECTDSRRLAVAPLGRLDMPMLLRVPAASLTDLGLYAAALTNRKTPYSGVVTKLSFDHDVAHQKFVFKALRYLTVEETEAVLEVSQQEVIQSIAGLNTIAATAIDSLGTPPAHITQTPKQESKPAAATPAPASKAKRAATVSDDEIEDAVATPPAATRGRPPGSVNGTKKATPAPVKEPEAPAAQPKVKKFDEAALVAEASASLDEALAALDD
jgi:hypothetical protein